LSHCELITDDGIGQLGGGLCAAESLTVLELDNCPLITDASLTHLSGCQSLRRIELYDCQLITRAGIHKLKVCIVLGHLWSLGEMTYAMIGRLSTLTNNVMFFDSYELDRFHFCLFFVTG